MHWLTVYSGYSRSSFDIFVAAESRISEIRLLLMNTSDDYPAPAQDLRSPGAVICGPQPCWDVCGAQEFWELGVTFYQTLGSLGRFSTRLISGESKLALQG